MGWTVVMPLNKTTSTHTWNIQVRIFESMTLLVVFVGHNGGGIF